MNTITLLVKNIQYFKFEVISDRLDLDETTDWQEVINLNFDPDDVNTVTQVSNDYYEFQQVI